MFQRKESCKEAIELMKKLRVPLEGKLTGLFGDDATVTLPEKGSDCDFLYKKNLFNAKEVEKL